MAYSLVHFLSHFTNFVGQEPLLPFVSFDKNMTAQSIPSELTDIDLNQNSYDITSEKRLNFLGILTEIRGNFRERIYYEKYKA